MEEQYYIKQTGGYAGGPFDSVEDAKAYVFKTVGEGGSFKDNAHIVDDNGKVIDNLKLYPKKPQREFDVRSFDRRSNERRSKWNRR